MKDGKIHEVGTPQELRSKADSEFNKLNMNHHVDNQEPERPIPPKQQPKPDGGAKGPSAGAAASGKEGAAAKTEAQKKSAGKLSTVETKQKGSIPYKVYKYYIDAGGSKTTTFILFLYFCSVGLRMVNDWWVGAWSKDEFDLNSETYVGYYALIGVGTTIAIFIRSLLFGLFARKTSTILQRNIIRSVFRMPLGWFDTTPKGRILNRLTKD